MSNNSEIISVVIQQSDGSPFTYSFKSIHAEALSVAILQEISRKDNDPSKTLRDRVPTISVQHPSFTLNTTFMNEVVLSLAPQDWRPFAFTLTKTAAEALRDGLMEMLLRLREIRPATKQ